MQIIIVISMFIFGSPDDELTELLPGLWVGESIVEFEGTIAIDCHHPDTPDVYLEMFVTAPDSREHESIVVASIKPSLLHAALLAAGAEPGSPIALREGKQVAAHGDRVQIFITTLDEEQPDDFIPIESWVIHRDTDETLDADLAWTGFVFAGSRLDKVGYAADRAGTLVSLTSFGDEVIAPTWTLSNQADVDEPVWIANRELVPKRGTPIRIRIEIIQEEIKSHEPDRVDIDGNM